MNESAYSTPTPPWAGRCWMSEGRMNGKYLLKLNFSKEAFWQKVNLKVKFWRRTEIWISSKRGYRIPPGTHLQRHWPPSTPLFQYTTRPAHSARHAGSSEMSDKQDTPLLTLGYWRWQTSARCNPVTTPSLAARRWSRSPTMVANRRTQSN